MTVLCPVQHFIIGLQCAMFVHDTLETLRKTLCKWINRTAALNGETFNLSCNNSIDQDSTHENLPVKDSVSTISRDKLTGYIEGIVVVL